MKTQSKNNNFNQNQITINTTTHIEEKRKIKILHDLINLQNSSEALK